MSALIVGLQPILTAFLLLSFWASVRATPLAGTLAGLAGVFIVLWPKLALSLAMASTARLFRLFPAVLAISAGTVWQKKTGDASDLVTGTALQYAGATLSRCCCRSLFENQQFDPLPELWFAMAWLVIVLSIGAIFLLMLLIRDGSMNRVGALFYLVPAVTALMAWALFDETLHDSANCRHGNCCRAVWVATAQPRESVCAIRHRDGSPR